MRPVSHRRAINPHQGAIVFCIPVLLSLGACGINLEAVNLEDLLIQPGDLPADYTVNPGQALSPQQMARWVILPPPLKGSELTFEHESVATGYVRVFLFETVADVEQAYGAMEEDFRQGFDADLSDRLKAAWNLNLEPEPRVGEAGLLVTVTYPFADSAENNRVKEYGMAELLFYRCHALVKARVKRTYGRAAKAADGSMEPASPVSAELASRDLLAYATGLDARLQQEICP